MSEVDKLKKLLKKDKELPKAPKKDKKEVKLPQMDEEVDVETISKIVDRMKEKYVKEGVMQRGESITPEKARKLREMIEYGPKSLKASGGGSARELVLFENPTVRFFGKFYMKMQYPIHYFSKMLHKSFGSKLDMDLQAAEMRYSVEQYLTLALSATILCWLIVLAAIFVLVLAFKLNLLIALLVILGSPFLCFGMAMIIPSNRAKKIATGVDKELPYALRHMSIEIRAGVGIFKTMESIASSDYGSLSDGFRGVLFEIEKGMPTEDALERWAIRTRSEGLRRMVSHLVRALRTGGNLSDIMITIAEDVSFERRMRIADFAEKLNLMSLFLMMIAIVMPVLLTILAVIGSSPSISQYLALFSMFSTQFLMVMYFVICPALLVMFMFFIKSADPD
jgi:flagellar protein FlaJ